MKLLLVIPFHKADEEKTVKLLQWLKELGGCKENSALFVAANNVNWLGKVEREAKDVFRDFTFIKPAFALKSETHPRGPNWMFETAIRHIFKNKSSPPFLWLEPDSVPIAKDWLQVIEKEYEQSGKRILACVTQLKDPRYPAKIASGVAVYPPNAWDIYAKLSMNRSVAWDIQFADEIMPLVHPSKAIFNRLNRENPPTFVAQRLAGPSSNTLGLNDLPDGTVLVHPCKDDSLVTVMRERFKKAGRSRFYHSGDLGDILASLIAMRELGGGEMFIGPDNQTSMATREKMTVKRAQIIIPLLEAQPYVHSAKFSDIMPPNLNYDLNQSRMFMRSEYSKGKPWINLAQVYLRSFGLSVANDQRPWLEVAPKGIAPVVIARSSRYHDEDFRWDRIVSEYRGQLVFVGLKSEHEDFCHRFGRVPHHQTANLLELAKVIAGCRLFVGNQSCPYWIAEGLKKPAILEVFRDIPNSMFKRADLIHGVTDKTTLPTITKPRPRKVKKGEALVIRGPVDTFSGFGQIIQTIAVGLSKRGIKTAVAPTMMGQAFQPDIPPLPSAYERLIVPRETPGQVIISMHCGLPHLIHGGEVVMTMWESTRINPETCDALNKAGHLILPTTWGATSFNASGVDTPISIVPLGVDTRIYKAKPFPKGKKFIFGAAGRVAHGGIRKGIEEVIAAFQKAFAANDKDVELWIKCFDDCPIAVPTDDRIKLHRRFLQDLAGWYGDLHCFVTASRGEGWGLQPHQAMACARPVIAPRFSGLTAFFDDSVGWPVDFELKPAGGYYEGKGIWAEVNVNDLAEKMIYAKEHISECRQKGEEASYRAARLSNDNMIDKFEAVLRKVGVL